MNRIITDHTKRVKAMIVIACCLALAAVGLAAAGVHAEGPSYNPYLIQGIVDQTTTGTGGTLLPVEFNGTGFVRFDVGNTGFDPLLLEMGDVMTLVITLSKASRMPPIRWTHWEALALHGFPGNMTRPSGPITRAQIATIPGESRATITIAYKVAENSFLGASPTVSNGFNVNLQPPGYTNPQPTDDDLVSSYTYVQAFDYGDAPNTYGSVSHVVDVTKDLGNDTYNRYIYLGAFVDPETVYQGSVNAMGDDDNQTGGLNGDDENGVSFPIMRQGETVTIPVVVTISDEGFEQSTPRLNGWIDWNGNGILRSGGADRH